MLFYYLYPISNIIISILIICISILKKYFLLNSLLILSAKTFFGIMKFFVNF